jgi:hypothetical protein
VLKGFDQAVISVYFESEPCEHVVVRHLVLAEIIVLPGDFLEGVCHIESIVLVLRVEDETQFVALFHKSDHLASAGVIATVHPLLGAAHLGIILMELISKDGKSMGKVFLVENGENRYA